MELTIIIFIMCFQMELLIVQVHAPICGTIIMANKMEPEEKPALLLHKTMGCMSYILRQRKV